VHGAAVATISIPSRKDRHSMKRVLPLLLVASALVVAGCGSSGSSSSSSSAAPAAPASSAAAPAAPAAAQSGTVPVTYQNIAISPANVTVKVGSTVKWTNMDMIDHNVTTTGGVQSFHSSDFGNGATFSMKVTTPGVIHYICSIHPTAMIGTITVVK
jgi:plastocyanin